MKIVRVAQSMVFYISAGLGGLAAAVAAIHMVVHIAFRVLGDPPLGTGEYIQFAYMPAIAVGGVAAAQRGYEHITVDVFANVLRGIALIVSRLVVLLVMLGLGVTLAVYAVDSAATSNHLAEAGQISGLPIWPGKATIGVAFSLFVLMVVLQFFDKRTYEVYARESATPESAVESVRKQAI